MPHPEQDDSPLTIPEFEAIYAQRSKVTVAWLHEQGLFGAECDCGDPLCAGFRMVHQETGLA